LTTQVVAAPRTSNSLFVRSFSVVSFFCGCGGLDLGLMGGFRFRRKRLPRLPFKILSAYDHDLKCVDTYKRNIDQHVSQVDLSDYDPRDMPAADVLTGGFPCQDFASCGPRRGLNSDRGRLYRSMIKYMDHHRPSVVVGENVPGLASLHQGKVLNTIVSDMEDCGYKVEVWRLYAPDYGVPQRRTRLFIVGVRDDLEGFPVIPVPRYTQKHRTIKWAINDLSSIDDESIPNQSQYFKASRAKKGNGQGDETSDPNKPSYTVRANAKSRVQFHYELNRRLTVRECARLQTFPDEFVFQYSATTNIMQIGNAVPPLLGYVVAKSLARFLETAHENE